MSGTTSLKGHQTPVEFKSTTDMSCQFPEDSQASERSGKAVVAELLYNSTCLEQRSVQCAGDGTISPCQFGVCGDFGFFGRVLILKLHCNSNLSKKRHADDSFAIDISNSNLGMDGNGFLIVVVSEKL